MKIYGGSTIMEKQKALGGMAVAVAALMALTGMAAPNPSRVQVSVGFCPRHASAAYTADWTLETDHWSGS